MSANAEHFDVVVVGARCAGSPLATMLANRGFRVCLLDRATFPSDSLSTHLVQPCGVQVLERIGVVDAMLDAGAVSIEHLTLVGEGVRIEAEAGEGVFAAPSLCLRRVKLDHLLVEAAAAAGADVRTATAATGLLREGGRVVGVATGGGELRGRLVVGADGRSSSVARLAGSSEYRVEPAGRLVSWAYFGGVADAEPRLRLASVAGNAYLSLPTDSGLFLAGVCPPMSLRDSFLAAREASFAAGIAAWPELARILAGAERVGPIRVFADWRGYFREAAGPGWALLGDAGHFKDPTPAQGISDALRQAERLAEAIAPVLDDQPALDGALREWWRWRDEDAHEMYGLATDMGSSSSGPLSDELMRQVGSEAGGGERLLRVLNHELPPSRLFTPGLIARAVAATVRRGPRQLPALAAELMTGAGREARRWWAGLSSPLDAGADSGPSGGGRRRRRSAGPLAGRAQRAREHHRSDRGRRAPARRLPREAARRRARG